MDIRTGEQGVSLKGYPETALPAAGLEMTLVGAPENSGGWSYAHHPSLAVFGGRLYAIWSNGVSGEDALGQRIQYAVSEDFKAWGTPKTLVAPRRGKYSELVLTAGGLHAHGDTLTAYFGQFEYQAEAVENGVCTRLGTAHTDTSLWAMTTPDGERWSEPVNVGIPIIPNHGPQRLRSGRLLICGNVSFPYTDDPSGLGGWRMSGYYPPEMGETLYDDGEGFWRVMKKLGLSVGLCEGAFFETDDGVLHMLLRNTGEHFSGRLWLTESGDDGESWSPPVETDFTDNSNKFHFGKLPDGRFYYVGTPDPAPAERRCPLVLSLSRDGKAFDRHHILRDRPSSPRHSGQGKIGAYGYPHSLVHEGSLYIVISVNKEDIAVLQIPINSLTE